MATTDTAPVIDPVAAGERVGVNSDTLKRWRRNGTGPRYIRIAHNRVRYRVADLEAWLDARTVTPGAAAAQPN